MQWLTIWGVSSWSYIGGSPGMLSNLPLSLRYIWKKGDETQVIADIEQKKANLEDFFVPSLFIFSFNLFKFLYQISMTT